jgi:hypothetical protein
MLRSRIHNAVIASALALAVALTGVMGAAFAQETATPPSSRGEGHSASTTREPVVRRCPENGLATARS